MAGFGWLAASAASLSNLKVRCQLYGWLCFSAAVRPRPGSILSRQDGDACGRALVLVLQAPEDAPPGAAAQLALEGNKLLAALFAALPLTASVWRQLQSASELEFCHWLPSTRRLRQVLAGQQEAAMLRSSLLPSSLLVLHPPCRMATSPARWSTPALPPRPCWQASACGRASSRATTVGGAGQALNDSDEQPGAIDWATKFFSSPAFHLLELPFSTPPHLNFKHSRLWADLLTSGAASLPVHVLCLHVHSLEVALHCII